MIVIDQFPGQVVGQDGHGEISCWMFADLGVLIGVRELQRSGAIRGIILGQKTF